VAGVARGLPPDVGGARVKQGLGVRD
jgi:hypothetical protein